LSACVARLPISASMSARRIVPPSSAAETSRASAVISASRGASGATRSQCSRRDARIASAHGQ
jgi:hypothetical protein